ncbi:unnamed protein product, partial [Polarella glacialis]
MASPRSSSPRNGSPRGSPRGDDDDGGGSSGSGGSPRASPRSPRGGSPQGLRSKKRRTFRQLLKSCCQVLCSRKTRSFPTCRCCGFFFPCFYCCYPDNLLNRQKLIDQMKKTHHGKEINMDIVEEAMKLDRDHQMDHKRKWRRRWKVCCCGSCFLMAAGLIICVVVFAIAPWMLLCDPCGWPGRAHFGAAITNGGRIIVAGGRDASQNFADVWSGDRDGKDWQRLAFAAAF